MDRFWLYAGLLLGAGVGYAALAPRGPRIIRGASRVLLIGDSLSVGLNPPLSALASAASVGYAYCGQQGKRIDEFVGSGPMAACWRTKAAALRPTHVLVVLGTNDAAMGTSYWPKQLQAAAALVAEIKAAGAECVWVSPAKAYPDGSLVAQLRKIVPNWFDSTTLGVPLADSIGHSSPKGYAGWAAGIWKALCRAC